MKSAEIRQSFLDFFARKNHEVVPSSSLVPVGDPTLLFTNAGMVQFKDVFLGKDKRSYQRAVSAQRVVRAGGKHNDLENVGYTARHHTFFEMLGNFSFGDYFKRDAIHYAWEFLTVDLKIPAEKLWVTVFHEDQEAEAIWVNEVGVPISRLSRLGEKDNFWAMGDTGPCGPCTEIFYDHGPSVAGGPPGSPDDDGDRYIEIWNLVFMQYNREASGQLVPLPKPSVDTGMGLERVAAVMQYVHNNYEIDLFQNLISAIAKEIGCDTLTHQSLRVIADHIRSSSFLVVDGVLPANEGRSYVLRRIIRRALRHGAKLGAKPLFFSRCVRFLVAEMAVAYPELAKAQAHIEETLKQEEERFAETLVQGMRIFEQDVALLKDSVIPGKTIFTLYDTYGFPVDLTNDIARERGLTLDMQGFNEAMAVQKARSRMQDGFKNNYAVEVKSEESSVFHGYDTLSVAAVLREIIDEKGILISELKVSEAKACESQAQVVLVLDQSPFYAESGGQVGDVGLIQAGHALFIVQDTQKYGNAILHRGYLQAGVLEVGQSVTAVVDLVSRAAIAANHSATHLLHAALRRVLGAHVTQKGSLVTAARLRFDFSHGRAISRQELCEIERLVNREIQKNMQVCTEKMSRDLAEKKGAMALFGEKYDSEVRVLTMGEAQFSVELCGGTHVQQLGAIGFFKIIAENSIASGIRRIEAMTQLAALDYIHQQESLLVGVAQLFKAPVESSVDKVVHLLEQQKKSEKEIERLNQKIAAYCARALLSEIKVVRENVRLLVASMPEMAGAELKELAEQCRRGIGEGCILLASVKEGKVSLVAMVTPSLATHFPAGQWIHAIAPIVGGKGGGKPDFAMAGGGNVAALGDALLQAQQWILGREA